MFVMVRLMLLVPAAFMANPAPSNPPHIMSISGEELPDLRSATPNINVVSSRLNRRTLAINSIGPACTEFKIIAAIIHSVRNVALPCSKAKRSAMCCCTTNDAATRIAFNFTYNIRQTEQHRAVRGRILVVVLLKFGTVLVHLEAVYFHRRQQVRNIRSDTLRTT